MKSQIKRAYVPCEVNVTEFNVEREFAGDSPFKSDYQFSINEQGTQNLVWSMTDDGNGNFRNMESYATQDFDW